jgi:hypothetical protein
MAQGLSPFEWHHPAGRKNDEFAVRIPANDHAALSDAQNDWPTGSMTNPVKNGPPRIAMLWRGHRDMVLHFDDLDEINRDFGSLLEDMDNYVSEFLGEDWWGKFLEMRSQKRKV